jgi:type I protein arginine methyltransferase
MSERKNCDDQDEDEDDNNQETMSDWEEDDEASEITIIDLFSPQIYHNFEAYIKDCKEKHSVDLIALVRSIGGDEIASIMMVNYIRSLVKASLPLSEIISRTSTKEFLKDEEFMRPVFPDDQLLFLLGEHLNEFDPSLDEEDQWAKADNYSFLHNVTAIPEPEVKQSTREEILEKIMSSTGEGEGDLSRPDDYYFDGYSHMGIHETMLRDTARTQAYADALLANSSLLQGKVVLDVGCGTGILSMLAARAGAKKVIGVDMSSILRTSQKVIERNGFGDRIELVRGRIEEIVLPLEEGELVDIIVSEWMGYGLYFENMLPAVMFARDRYLRRGEGEDATDTALFPPWSIMPSHATLFVEALSAQQDGGGSSLAGEDRVAWWGDVYGFDMSDMVDLFLPEAQVDTIPQQLVVSNRALFHELSILTAQDRDLDFTRPFELVSTPPRPLCPPESPSRRPSPKTLCSPPS